LSHLQSDVSVHGGYKLRKRANVGGLPAKGGQTVRNLSSMAAPLAWRAGRDKTSGARLRNGGSESAVRVAEG